MNSKLLCHLLFFALGLGMVNTAYAQCSPYDTTARPPLTIVSAVYGYGTTWWDFTDKLRAEIVDDYLYFHYIQVWQQFGDPLPGQYKVFKVTYKLGDQQFYKEYDDYDIIWINVPAQNIDCCNGHIIKATYHALGADTRSVDCTEALKKYIINCHLQWWGESSAQAFGDPAFGEEKILTVEYEGGGVTHTACASDWGGAACSSRSLNIDFGTNANKVDKPVISPDGGVFYDTVSVTLSITTPGGSIRYTTDGSTPTALSTLYSGPFKLTATATVKAIGIKSGMNNSAVAAATLTKRDASIPYQLNCGGGEVLPFEADGLYSGGTASTGTGDVTTSGVANPAPASVYQTARYGNFTYTLTGLTAGAGYTVRLHFAELSNSTPGSRIFHILVNGTMAQPNLDIFAVTGAINKALVKEFPVTADAAGQVEIRFIPVVGNAVCNGIELIKNQTSIGQEQGRVLSGMSSIPNPLTRTILVLLVKEKELIIYDLAGRPLPLNHIRRNGIYLVGAEGPIVGKIAVLE